jgi:tetratricopeptide (TPR) repeat protein
MSRGLLAAMLLTAAAAGGMSLAGAGTTALYATAALAVLALMRSIGTSPVSGRQLAACGVVAAASATLAWTFVLPPSRADRLARIAGALERRQDWPGAVSGYRAALSLQPSESEYLTGLGRSLLEQAERDDSQRDRLFTAADETLRKALARNPYDPHHSRNVANAARRRAAVTTEPAARASLLAQADQLFERATAAAPGMALLWVDWGNVALVRGALEEASSRLDRAEHLDATNVELWVLRALVEVRRRRFDAALAAYDRALVLRSDHAAALRGRAVVLATMGRTADAIGATERLLRVYPSDDLGLRLKASLAAPGAAAAAP